MDSPPIAAVSALIGDPARALMLSTLMDGRAYTASELADVAGVTRQTASAHLTRLTDGGLLALATQGRHRYYRLRTPRVAAVLEALMVFGDQRIERRCDKPLSPERAARTCYDHLAGTVGVALLDHLCRNGHIRIVDTRATLSPSGRRLVEGLGLDVETLDRGRRPLVKPCLDWSERRDHLSGSLGAALLDYFLEEEWIRRRNGSRAVFITPRGERHFLQVFGFSPRRLIDSREHGHERVKLG